MAFNSTGQLNRYFSCKDCLDRHPCCWSTCEKYQAAKKGYEKEKESDKERNRSVFTAEWIKRAKAKQRGRYAR
jgi:hypothetical protein